MVRFLMLVSGLCILPGVAFAENNGLNPGNDSSLPVRAAKGDRLIRVVSADKPTVGARPKLLRQLGSVEATTVNSK